MSGPGDYVMPFGKYRGKTIDHVAESDDGLLYLDWLVGQDWLRDPFKGVLRKYLADDSIQLEIDKLEDRGR